MAIATTIGFVVGIALGCVVGATAGILYERAIWRRRYSEAMSGQEPMAYAADGPLSPTDGPVSP